MKAVSVFEQETRSLDVRMREAFARCALRIDPNLIMEVEGTASHWPGGKRRACSNTGDTVRGQEHGHGQEVARRSLSYQYGLLLSKTYPGSSSRGRRRYILSRSIISGEDCGHPMEPPRNLRNIGRGLPCTPTVTLGIIHGCMVHLGGPSTGL